MGRFNLTSVIDEGLGNSTYLLDVGQGRALVLDPERDLRAGGTDVRVLAGGTAEWTRITGRQLQVTA